MAGFGAAEQELRQGSGEVKKKHPSDSEEAGSDRV